MAKLNIAVPHTREGALDRLLYGMFCERETVKSNHRRQAFVEQDITAEPVIE